MILEIVEGANERIQLEHYSQQFMNTKIIFLKKRIDIILIKELILLLKKKRIILLKKILQYY